MKILFICHRLPYPPNEGGKIRAFNMIRHLHRHHSVVVASLAHTQKELDDGIDLKDYCDGVIAELLPASVRWLQAGRAIATGAPSSVAYFSSPQLRRKIHEAAGKIGFDAAIVHCAFAAQYVDGIRTRRKILDFCDIDSRKWFDYSQQKPFPQSVVFKLEAAKLRKYERKVAALFDCCTVASAGELEEYGKLDLSVPCAVIPNGVDTSFFQPRASGRSDGSVIVFLGRMDYFPNVDGVNYFAREVFPLIRHQRPDTKFRIIGSNPARSVRDLAGIPNVSVTGQVPDVRSYLEDAAVSVAPLKIARGIQNKILESMAMGIPVVATPQAVKGIGAELSQYVAVAEKPEIFAAQVLALLENNALHTRMAEGGRLQVQQGHAWPSVMEILENLITEDDKGKFAVGD